MKHLKHITITLALFLILTGCATYVPPTPAYNLSEDAKIGLLVVANNEATHTHVGTTIFNNFVKKYPVDWDLEATIFNQFKDEIENNTPYNVKNLKELGYMDEQLMDFVGVKNKQWIFHEKSTPLREKLLADGVKFVVIIREGITLAAMECGQYGCTNHYSEGYGLFSRSFFGLDRYMASMSFDMTVEALDTPIDVLLTKPFNQSQVLTEKSKQMEDFADPKQFEALTQEELAPIQGIIVNYFKNLATQTRAFLNGEREGNK